MTRKSRSQIQNSKKKQNSNPNQEEIKNNITLRDFRWVSYLTQTCCSCFSYTLQSVTNFIHHNQKDT